MSFLFSHSGSIYWGGQNMHLQPPPCTSKFDWQYLLNPIKVNLQLLGWPVVEGAGYGMQDTPPTALPQSLTRTFSKSKKPRKFSSPKSQVEFGGGGGGGIWYARNHPTTTSKFDKKNFVSPKRQKIFKVPKVKLSLGVVVSAVGRSDHHWTFFGHFTFERMSNVRLHISCDDIII